MRRVFPHEVLRLIIDTLRALGCRPAWPGLACPSTLKGRHAQGLPKGTAPRAADGYRGLPMAAECCRGLQRVTAPQQRHKAQGLRPFGIRLSQATQLDLLTNLPELHSTMKTLLAAGLCFVLSRYFLLHCC